MILVYISDKNGAFETIEICHIILFYINNSSNHTAKISVPSRLFDFGEEFKGSEWW